MTLKRRVKNSAFGAHKSAGRPRFPKRIAKSSGAKVLPFRAALALSRAAKAHKMTVVTTNGCFDILHVGHVRYLEEAKRHGDILIVGVNSDASVKRNKGDSRPINTELERAEIITSLKCVDAVFIFDETTPIEWLGKLQPHVHVKGGDRTIDQIIEKDAVEKTGGKIVLAKVVPGRSTTNVLKKILNN